jgi:general stress protein YciG
MRFNLSSMSPERRRQIASMGGRKAHANGKAHKFTTETAKRAGQKGGLVTSQDREHMKRISALGGQRSRQLREMKKFVETDELMDEMLLAEKFEVKQP